MDKKIVGVRTVSKPTFYQRVFKFRYVLFVLIICFAVLTFFARTSPYFPFDLIITKSIQTFNYQWFASLMRAISYIGDFKTAQFSLAIAVVTLLLFKRLKDSLFIFLSTAGIGLLSETLKRFVGRPRPDPEVIIQIGKFFRSDSFPSGHVLFFMGFYGFLLFLAYSQLKPGLLRTSLLFIFLTLIIMVGFSRIYLGAHWFSDVLGAYLIGTSWILLLTMIYRKVVIKLLK